MLINNSIELNNLGEAIPVKVRTSTKARNISIRIHYHKVELVIPERACKNTAYKFLFEKEAWVRRKITAKERIPQPIIPPANQISILGKNYLIEYQDSQLGKATMTENTILVQTTKSRQNRLLRCYLKQHILNKIKIAVKTMATQHGFKKYGKISVKELKSRWGSCSASGNLAFNWRIIFAPEHVFYYLLAHELCHLKQMNHSSKFWKLVAEICPDYQTSRNWLRKHGAELYYYLADTTVEAD